MPPEYAFSPGSSIDTNIVNALKQKLVTASAIVAEHILWALSQQSERKKTNRNCAHERLNARLIRSIEKGLPRDA